MNRKEYYLEEARLKKLEAKKAAEALNATPEDFNNRFLAYLQTYNKRVTLAQEAVAYLNRPGSFKNELAHAIREMAEGKLQP